MNLNDIAMLAVAEDAAARLGLVALSDIHSSGVDAIELGDAPLVVIAGDLMGAGADSDAAGRSYLEEVFFPWCRAHSNQDFILTAGNHDKFLYRMWSRGERLPWPKNVHYLIDSGATVCGVQFWGTPWCLKNRPGRFEGEEADLARAFAKIPSGVDVLVSHCPPYIPGERSDANEDGLHEGSKELTEAILAKRPRLCICGHVHSGSRRPVKLGDTVVVNVALVEEDRHRAKHHPRRLDFLF